MGSAAFLNEAINQLAEEYLQRKQTELGQDHRARPLRRREAAREDVHRRHNVFGVDLNPRRCSWRKCRSG